MIGQIVDKMIKEATENTTTGNWIFYLNSIEDDFHLKDGWLSDNLETIKRELIERKEISDVEIDNESISIWLWLDYCPNVETEGDD